MDPVTNKILQGTPFAGMGGTQERNALIGVIRNLISQDKYTVDYILNYAQSVGYQRQMAEEVFKELTGLSPKLIVNNNEYYNMPSYVPNMCIAWGMSKSNKEKAFYIVPFEYGFAVMEKDEVNAPIPTVISATIPEAFDELKKVAKGIQTLDKIITKKLLETEDVQTDAKTVHQVNLPYAASPLQILKKNFKDKVINVSEFERQASKLLASEEITVDEAEDLMAWKQDLIDEDETYGNDVLELDEQWKPLDAEEDSNSLEEALLFVEELISNDNNNEHDSYPLAFEEAEHLFGIDADKLQEEYDKRHSLLNKASKKVTSDKIMPSDIYEIAVEKLPSEDIDHHNSDLYIKVTPESKKLIEMLEYKDSGMLTIFKDSEGMTWYDLPFCYPMGKKQASSKEMKDVDDTINYYSTRLDDFISDYYGDNAAMQSEVDYDFLNSHKQEMFDAWKETFLGDSALDEWQAAEKAYNKLVNSNKKQAGIVPTEKITLEDGRTFTVRYNPNEKGITTIFDENGKEVRVDAGTRLQLLRKLFHKGEPTIVEEKSASKKVTAETYKDKGWTIEKIKDGYVVRNEKGYIMRTPFNTEEEAEKYINEPVKPNYVKTDGYPIFDGRRKASKKVTAENMDLEDIEAEDNKDQVQEEIEKIDETPAEDVFSETTPEQYFEKSLQEDKVDTINDVVSKCIDKFSEKFKDFDKYTVKILSYNTKVLGDYEPTEEELVEDKELNANAILQVIMSITNKADEATMKKVLAVFSITNGELHWTGTVRGENDQVVAFTEEGLDALFEVEEPSEEELEDII